MATNIRLFVVLATIVAAVVLFASNVLAKNDDGTRPGWGFGDKNHVHTGPPGQSVSVHPGDDQDENEHEEDDNDQGRGHEKEKHGNNHDEGDDD